MRIPALWLFSLLLAACVTLEVCEAVKATGGKGVVLAFDLESEESEEGQEEEREGPEEQKDKTSKYEAFLNGERVRLALQGRLPHRVSPDSYLQSLVDARVWEPPELG